MYNQIYVMIVQSTVRSDLSPSCYVSTRHRSVLYCSNTLTRNNHSELFFDSVVVQNTQYSFSSSVLLLLLSLYWSLKVDPVFEPTLFVITQLKTCKLKLYTNPVLSTHCWSVNLYLIIHMISLQGSSPVSIIISKQHPPQYTYRRLN